MALAFAKEGMKLVVSDIDPKSLDAVTGEIKKTGIEVLSSNTSITLPYWNLSLCPSDSDRR
jgi:hypothetical protein